MIDFSLTREQENLLEEVRAIVEEKIAPLAGELDQAGDGVFIPGPAEALARANLLTPTIPLEYNGRGMDYFTTALLLEEVSAACAGLAAVVTANIHAASPIVLAGSKLQMEAYLPLLTGKEAGLASFALTEGSSGSDIEGMETRAVPLDKNGRRVSGADAEGWLINGAKEYILNAVVAKFITLFASSDKDHKKAGMLAFVVPADAQGISVGEVQHKMGIRYAGTASLIFNDLRLDSGQVIGKPGSAYLLLMQTFDRGRSLAGAIGVGIARAAYEYTLQYSRERIQFGRPVYSKQGVSFVLADMATRIEAARMLVWKACWLIDRDMDYTMASSMAKLVGSRVAVQSASLAMELCGGAAYLTDHPVERYLRDARVMPLIEGTDNIQKAVIASFL